MEPKALSICVAVLLLPLAASQVPPEGDGFYVHFDFQDSLDASHPLPMLWYGQDGLTVTTTTWVRDNDGVYWRGDAGNTATIQVDCNGFPPEVFGAYCDTDDVDMQFKVNPDTVAPEGPGVKVLTFSKQTLDQLIAPGMPATLVHIWSHPNQGPYASSQYFTHANALAEQEEIEAADAASDAGGWQPVLLVKEDSLEQATGCGPGRICDIWDGFIHVIEPRNTAIGPAGETLVAPRDGYFEFVQKTAFDNTGDTDGIAFRDLTNGHYPWTSLAIGGVVVPEGDDPSPHEWFSLGRTENSGHVERIAQEDGSILWRVEADRLFESLGHEGEAVAGPAYIQSNIFYKPREGGPNQYSGASGDRVGYDMDNKEACAALVTDEDGVNGQATPDLCPYSTGHFSRAKNALMYQETDRESLGLGFGAAEVADLMEGTFHDAVVFVSELPGDGFVGHIEVEGAVPGDQGLVLTYGPGDDVTVHVTPYASGSDGYTFDGDHAYYLRMFYLDEAGATHRVPAENSDRRFWAETPGEDGRYTFTFPADELPDSPIGAQGLNVQVHRAPTAGADVDATSQLFLPKEAALAAGGEAAAAAADATEAGAFTPLFIVPSGDGSYAVIEPLNVLRTEAGTVMEANLRGNYVFHVCLKNTQGEDKAIGDFRFEMVGISDADAPAAPHAVFSVGSMGDVDRMLPSAGEQACIFVDIPRSAVGGSLLYDQFYHVRFVTEGATSAYSEQTNDLDALDAAAAHAADGHAPTGVLLVPRNGSPSQGAYTIGGLLGGFA